MHVAGHAYHLMSEVELERVHDSAIRVLAEIGMEIQNETLLSALAEASLPVDFDAQRVTFPRAAVEAYLAGVEQVDWDAISPQASGYAGVYGGQRRGCVPTLRWPGGWTICTGPLCWAAAHRFPPR